MRNTRDCSVPIIDESPFYQETLKPPRDKGLELLLEAMSVPGLSTEDVHIVHFYNNNPLAQERLKTHFKSYPDLPQIPLVQNQDEEIQVGLETAIKMRHAQRSFNDQPLSFSHLSKMLTLGYGFREEDVWTKRTAPSGGARYCSEIYPIVFNVEGVPAGIYHYNIKSRALEQISAGDYRKEMQSLYDSESMSLENANVLLVVTAVFDRSVQKYGKRGWKLLLMDVGHIGQNFWLLATAMGLGFCPHAGGFEHKLAEIIKINKYVELPVVAYVVGHPASERSL